MRIKTIHYHITGSPDLFTLPIKSTLLAFKESKDGENYEKYRYPFSICIIRYLMGKIDGIKL